MSDSANNSERPSDRLYVTMTDSFMSGWGDARGTKNKLVIVCDTLEEARIVEANAHSREEQKHVNICHTDPVPRYKRRGYCVNLFGRGQGEGGEDNYTTWFEPNAFNGR